MVDVLSLLLQGCCEQAALTVERGEPSSELTQAQCQGAHAAPGCSLVFIPQNMLKCAGRVQHEGTGHQVTPQLLNSPLLSAATRTDFPGLCFSMERWVMQYLLSTA